jgi:hypothetical protein
MQLLPTAHFMPKDTDTDNAPKMIGLEMLQNMTDLDRAQEVWDRAMPEEAKDYMWALAAFKAGRGPDPGKYKGPVIDFEKAAEELEEEEPRWTSRSEDLWEERQREREAQGLEREPHPLGEDYE